MPRTKFLNSAGVCIISTPSFTPTSLISPNESARRANLTPSLPNTFRRSNIILPQRRPIKKYFAGQTPQHTPQPPKHRGPAKNTDNDQFAYKSTVRTAKDVLTPVFFTEPNLA